VDSASLPLRTTPCTLLLNKETTALVGAQGVHISTQAKEILAFGTILIYLDAHISTHPTLCYIIKQWNGITPKPIMSDNISTSDGDKTLATTNQ